MAAAQPAQGWQAFAPLRHVGIYSYRAVSAVSAAAPAPTPAVEALEQLQGLWLCHRIAVHLSDARAGLGVDTPEPGKQVRRCFADVSGPNPLACMLDTAPAASASKRKVVTCYPRRHKAPHPGARGYRAPFASATISLTQRDIHETDLLGRAGAGKTINHLHLPEVRPPDLHRRHAAARQSRGRHPIGPAGQGP